MQSTVCQTSLLLPSTIGEEVSLSLRVLSLEVVIEELQVMGIFDDALHMQNNRKKNMRITITD